MTANNSFTQQVRARASKTGESYRQDAHYAI